MMHIYQSTKCNILEELKCLQHFENPKPFIINFRLRRQYYVETSINAPTYRKLKLINFRSRAVIMNMRNTLQLEFSLEFLMVNCVNDCMSAKISLASTISYEV
jgi:hypothetical protein